MVALRSISISSLNYTDAHLLGQLKNNSNKKNNSSSDTIMGKFIMLVEICQ